MCLAVFLTNLEVVVLAGIAAGVSQPGICHERERGVGGGGGYVTREKGVGGGGSGRERESRGEGVE
jgi:hypothetical protein